MRFPDPTSAGHALAQKLDAYAERKDFIILAVASGGVEVACAVAEVLRLPVDIVLLRRLLVPRGPQDPLCATSVAGNFVLDEEVTERRARDELGLEFFLAHAIDELKRRERTCRSSRPPLSIQGKSIILIDNGIRTGSTLRAVLRAVRTLEPATILAAVPVTSTEGKAVVEPLVDQFVCLATPDPFGHVGMWYRELRRPSDEQIATWL